MILDHTIPGDAAIGAEISGAKRLRRHILLVDDQPIFRQGLCRILERVHDLHVCGEAESIDGARAALHQCRPDILITEIDLVRSDGMELVRHARREHPKLPILVLSAYDEAIYANRLLSAGASGYIMKQTDSAQLVVAIRRVLAGGIYVSKNVSNLMIEKFEDESGVVPTRRLSNREFQILQMIGKGFSTQESADVLHLSAKTIESHRQRIKRKLNLRTGVQLVQYAVSNRFARCT